MSKLNFGLDKKKLIIIIGIILLVIGVAFGGFFGVKAIIKNKENKLINYYNATFYFIDDQNDSVANVSATLDGNVIATSDEKGKLSLEHIPENSSIKFSVKEYDFASGEDVYLISKDVKLKFIYVTRNSNYIPIVKPNNVTVSVFDDNGFPLQSASVSINNKYIGLTNSKGAINTRIEKDEVVISVQLKYYNFDNKTMPITIDDINNCSIYGKFNKDNYFAKYEETGEDGTVIVKQNETLSCSYYFVKEDGTQVTNYKITYKDSSGSFHSKSFYNIREALIFEQMASNKLFSNLYCYSYDDASSSWYASEIIHPTTCSGQIKLKKAYCVNIQYVAKSSLYASNGLTFSSNDSGVVSIVMLSFEDIVFYRNYLGNQLMYPLKVYNEKEEEVKIDPSKSQTLHFV